MPTVPTIVSPEVSPVVSLPVVSVFDEHSDSVVGCDWMRTSDSVVSGSKDSSLKIWDVNSLQSQTIEIQFPSGDNNVSSHLTNVFAHPSQPTVMAPGSDGLVRVWDIRELKLVDLISHSSDKACVTHALFSQDGGLIISGGEDRLLKLWDSRNTAAPIDVIRCASVQTKFSLSTRTSTLAIPMKDAKLKLCDTQGYNIGSCESHKYHKEALTAAVWSQDEWSLFTSSEDERNNVICWSRNEK
jgi:WD40 repeat protein